MQVTVSSLALSKLPSEHSPSMTNKYVSVMPLKNTIRRETSNLSAALAIFSDAISAGLQAANVSTPMKARTAKTVFIFPYGLVFVNWLLWLDSNQQPGG